MMVINNKEPRGQKALQKKRSGGLSVRQTEVTGQRKYTSERKREMKGRKKMRARWQTHAADRALAVVLESRVTEQLPLLF